MAYEIGGRADKYGNRFEYNWVVNKLLDVIEEKKFCVILEALGEDEAGVDLWVVDNEGNREGQQCKGRNASEDCWTYSSINEKGLWNVWKQQLDRDDNICVSLVSPLAFTALEDITERARNNNGNPYDFYRIQINQSGKKIRDLFNHICKTIKIDPNEDDGCKYILSYFKRIYYRQYPDSELKTIVIDRIYRLFNGNPEAVYSLLLDYVLTQDVYGKEITTYALNKYLNSQKITFRNLANDSRIMPKIQELNEEYIKSFNMFSSGMIFREESKQCWEYIKQGKSIIIHGQAGAGKSGCTSNIISWCEKEAVPYLAIKLDKRIPMNSTEEWSRSMGLPASISHCVDSISKDRSAVIILDQLDALRWTQAHSGLALVVCMRLIREIKMINNNRVHKISLIFVCRSYDLKNDTGIKSLFDEENKEKSSWEEVEVNLLNENEIKQVVGDSFDKLSGKIRKLLRVASNLYIWEHLDKTQNYEKIEATYQLVKEWWNQIVTRSGVNNLESSQLGDIRDRIVAFCDKKGRIAVPMVLINIAQDYKVFLVSSGFMIESNNTVSFSHQSILDCFLAEQMIQKYYREATLLDIIGDIDRQTPGRRYQVQIFLQQLSEISQEDFLEMGKQLLEQDGIRYSFRYVFWEVLSQLSIPESCTVEFVFSLLCDAKWKTPILNTVIRGKKIYIKRLITDGILDDWMEDDYNRETVINLCASRMPDYDNEEISFLKKYILQDGNGRTWRTCFYGDIHEGSDEYFELRLEFYKKHPETLETYLDLKSMLLYCEIRTVKILALMLEISKKNSEESIYKYVQEFSCEDSDALIHDYMSVLSILVPHLPKFDEYSRCYKWSGRYYMKGNLERACVLIIKVASRQLAKAEPERFFEYYSFCMGKGNSLYNEIILDAMFYMPFEYADRILGYLQSNISKNCFEELSGNGNELYYTKQLVKKYSEVCSESVLRSFENRVIHYISERATKKLRRRMEQNEEQKKVGERRVYWNFWGDFQYEILENISESRRSTEVNELIKVLERRFGGKDSIYNYLQDTPCCNVISPVDRKKLSANSWMKIIHNPKIKEVRNLTWLFDKQVCIESSLEEFVRGFRAFVEENTLESIELFLKETDHVLECFVDSLFDGISSSKKLKEIPSNKIEDLVRKFGYDYTSFRAKYICRIVEKAADNNWSDYILSCIKDIAINHSGPEDQPIMASQDNKKIETVELLESNALNCVRGYAIKAIEQLLWTNAEYYSQFKECISELVDDENLIINYAVLWALCPVFNIEKTWAVEKIMHIYSKNYKMIGFYNSRWMFCRCFLNYRTIILDAINKAVTTNDERLVKVSGYSMVELHMIYGEYEDLIDIYYKAEKNLRRVMLEMLIIYFGISKYKFKAKSILMIIVNMENDLDNDILWGRVFRDEMLDVKEDADLIKKILCSKIRRGTLRDFSEYILKQGELKEFADLIIESGITILEKNRDDDHQLWGLDTELSKLIIGLYDITATSNLEKDKIIARRCLDVWDKMYEFDVGMARTFTDQMINL